MQRGRARLGGHAAERAAAIAALADRLARAVPEDLLAEVRDARAAMDAAPGRIVLSGLAGTDPRRLANALIARPGFLPAAAPGSATVTRLVVPASGEEGGGMEIAFADGAALPAASAEPGGLRRAAAAVPESADPAGAIAAERADLARAAGDAAGTLQTAGEPTAAMIAAALGDGHGATGAVAVATLRLAAPALAGPVELVAAPALDPDRILPEEAALAAAEGADAVVVLAEAGRAPTALERAFLGRLHALSAGPLAIALDGLDGAADTDARLDGWRRGIARALPGSAAQVIGVAPDAPVSAAAAQGMALLSDLLGEALFWGAARARHVAAAARLETVAREGARLHRAACARAQRIAALEDRVGTAVPSDPAATARIEAARADAAARLDAETDHAWSAVHARVLRVLAGRVRETAEALHRTLDAGDAPLGAVPLAPISGAVAEELTRALGESGRAYARVIEAATGEIAVALAEARPEISPPVADTAALAAPEIGPAELGAPPSLPLDVSRRALLLRGLFRREDRVAWLAERLTAALMSGATRAIEDRTLALGRTARDTLALLAEEAAARLTAPARAEDGAAEAEALEARAGSCLTIAGQLAAIRAALDDAPEPAAVGAS